MRPGGALISATSPLTTASTPGAATGHSQVPAARRKIIGTRGLDLAGHPLMKAGVP